MGSALRLDDAIVSPLLPAASDATAQTTASGSWVDVSNYVGDCLVVVNVGSVTGSFGSLAVQAQVSAANTGASPVNVVDPRNSGLLTITATGTYVMPINTDGVGKAFIGVACTYTGITAAVMSVELIGRKTVN